MRRNESWLIFFITIFLISVTSLAFAWPPKAARPKHADKNKDGIVDKKERIIERQYVIKHKGKARANTPLEKQYDKNGDGWIDSTEAKEMLRDRYTLIKTHGQAKVDTDIEAEYDINKDGVIDANEAKAFKEVME